MINTESFIKRLEIILDYYSLSASSFADKIGAQRSSMSHLLSGRNKPSLDFMLKIMEVFPDVDLYWLLNGKGSFPKSEDAIETKRAAPTPIQIETIAATKIEKSIEAVAEKISISANLTEATNGSMFSKTPSVLPQKTDTEIERIVIFYKNGTFKTYAED
ncbi:helix-turn-helix transcriptional regulator [Flavobacterium nackdongense]|uniref:XRE family transcriptional regulator n=1 Tax=Flavobacterium nackdongense TaxID=2547394 RepID=A0A4P6Y5D9_9FLAO|nr:helix-turn-helix transcriptional regulator [Flavobacterium nackdongense]QBN17321.1 XRE family transcriptional regulator [Flavobacterium nackdongense]